MHLKIYNDILNDLELLTYVFIHVIVGIRLLNKELSKFVGDLHIVFNIFKLLLIKTYLHI